ncbi:MAG: sensor histidine kinase [Bacteroidales bacterium]|nr:sensor histidine kinase [Bacteroidales bacterium]
MKGIRIKFLLHLAFWAVVITLPWFMVSGNLEQPGFFEGRYYLRLLNGGVVFYLTYFYLVPVFYLNNRKIYFFSLVILAIGLLYGATELLSSWLFPDDLLIQRLDLIREKMAGEGLKFGGPTPIMRYANSAFASIMIAAMATGLRITEAYSEKDKRNRELEKEKLASDLSLLKSQISPHFFFNTLNNIYALTEAGSPEAGNAVLKLSKMMRYVLYESDSEPATLDHEITFMNHYIDLMRLRLNEKVKVSVDFRPHSGEISLPPMIFISLIENAFKHGVSYREPSYIDIGIRSTPEELIFTCSNSKHGNKGEVHSGIGLENLRKRLALLYPGRHTLNIVESAAEFEVNLSLQLKQPETIKTS